MDVLKKKQKRAKCEGESGDTVGDAWICSCIKRHTYFFVAFAVGKWTQETCRQMVEQISRRFQPLSRGEKAVFYSDGNDDYTYVLPEFFPLEKLVYGQLIKVKKGGRLVGKIKRPVYGTPPDADIETTDTENFNGILRERLGRLVREIKCYSKLKKQTRRRPRIIPVALELHGPTTRKKHTSHARRTNRRRILLAPIFLSTINYSKLGHYQKFVKESSTFFESHKIKHEVREIKLKQGDFEKKPFL